MACEVPRCLFCGPLRTMPPACGCRLAHWPCAAPMAPTRVQVLGTFISALVFGLATYLLVLVGIVSRSHLAGAPFVECLLYGEAWGPGCQAGG